MPTGPLQIWFACKKCGRRDSRSASEAGTLVFCPCSYGNRVPWNSTVEPDEVPPLEAIPVRKIQPIPVPVPTLEPIPVEKVPPRSPTPGKPPLPLESGLPIPRPRNPLLGKVNPSFCFHHEDNRSATVCDACKLPFCPMCVVFFQGETLCGPCKNFRIAAHSRAVKLWPPALIALIVSLISGPVALLLSLVGISLFVGDGLVAGAAVLCLLGMGFPILGMVLSIRALRELEKRPEVGGRAPALGAMCAGAVATLWCLTVMVMVLAKRMFS